MSEAAAAPEAGRTGLEHHGRAGELFPIYLINLLLTIATLGIYRYWAKTRIRAYMWSQTSWRGDRFEYGGRGGELFKGFLIVLAVLSVVGLAYEFVYVQAAIASPALAVLLDFALSAAIMLLAPMAVYRARRYKLSRTVWRGIRGAQTGSALEYGFRVLGHVFLTTLTLGLSWPFMTVALAGHRLNNSWFGSRRFEFDGSGRDLFRGFLPCWLLLIPTLGLSWFWYWAASQRYIAAHTRYDALTFASAVRGGELLWLSLTNALATIFSLGLAYPWVLVRNARFIAANLTISGEPDFAAIAQSQAERPRHGEGLADILDVGDM